MTLSYALEEKEIRGMYNPVNGKREKVIVPKGLQVDASVTVFKGIRGLEFQADIQIVIYDGSLLINYTQTPVNFANVFKLTSYDDEAKGPNMYASLSTLFAFSMR